MKNMNRVHDLTGQKFGRLTVIGLDDTKQIRRTYWICQCDCGNIKSVRSDGLLCGRTKSCGCYKSEQDAIRVTKNHKHKQSGTRLYHIWQGMKGRCNNPHDPNCHRWGGTGISVCEEWASDFTAFYQWALNNGFQEDLTIDRIDNDGNYEPSNCQWSTSKMQARNRRSNTKITIGNSTRTLTEWCEIFDLDKKTVRTRYGRKGFVSIDDLFNK